MLSEALTTWGVRHGDPTVDEDALTIIIPIFSRTPLKTHDLLSEFFRISPVYTATVTYAHPLSRRVVPTRGRSR
ncbi:MAG TPA: hypothetical protein VI322_00815 [Candidatus Saccharimonadia bacterium]